MRDKREVNERDRAIAYRARNHGYQGLGTPMLGVRPFYFDRTLGMTNKTHDGMLAKSECHRKSATLRLKVSGPCLYALSLSLRLINQNSNTLSIWQRQSG